MTSLQWRNTTPKGDFLKDDEFVGYPTNLRSKVKQECFENLSLHTWFILSLYVFHTQIEEGIFDRRF